MCVFMSDKPFDAEACDIGGQASATNGSPDLKTHIENACVIDPFTSSMQKSVQFSQQMDRRQSRMHNAN
jgi:hypothetical protein